MSTNLNDRARFITKRASDTAREYLLGVASDVGLTEIMEDRVDDKGNLFKSCQIVLNFNLTGKEKES